ncbi:MAG TPA: FkbM family methyltransferase, partial [Thermodesulfobacteriota bacterium]|nr:FkbM family methyltransferase [Thermodesulfobacteriota bacterium]
FPSLGPENYFYFNNDVFPLSEKEIFVDMGAFDGDSITAFVQACRNRGVNYEHIYAFEPDPRNYDALLRTTGHMQKISYHKLGLWSHRKVLRFESSDKAFTTTASGVHENGDIEIEVVGLDEFLQGEKVTLIKMDPPGDILRDALQGAAETITRHKPKLVLNAYNKLEDIFEVPLLVNRRWPDYRLYLRHISWTICETDLFAVA